MAILAEVADEGRVRDAVAENFSADLADELLPRQACTPPIYDIRYVYVTALAEVHSEARFLGVAARGFLQNVQERLGLQPAKVNCMSGI